MLIPNFEKSCQTENANYTQFCRKITHRQCQNEICGKENAQKK
jgi:hypothetical protein